MRIEPEVVSHYERVAHLYAERFGGIPLVAMSYPDGLGGDIVFSTALPDNPRPPLATVAVPESSGKRHYVACTSNAIAWFAKRGAIELCSWTPTPDDVERCRYARILVHRSGAVTREDLWRGLRAIRRRLQADRLDAIALLDGRGGAGLWIPLAGAPDYHRVLAYLHRVSADVIGEHATLFSTKPSGERGNRLNVSIASNEVGRFSVLPYSAVGEPQFPVVRPIAWDDLDAQGEPLTVATFPAWHAANGDLFTEFASALDAQHLPLAGLDVELSFSVEPWCAELAAVSRGPNIRAAIAVLGDGKVRGVDDILAEAVRRGLLASTTPGKQLYTALIEYIARARGVGRVPQIVQDADRRFRINEPADDWPAPDGWAPNLGPHPQADALIAALRASGHGADPAAFEMDVCRAFTALGFIATHVGGQAAPDGLLDAPLGPLAYRAMIECKTARGTDANPDVAEAAKYRDGFHAQYATLIGPSFPDEATVISELTTHRVSAWTIDDLGELLLISANPSEMRPLFDAGFVADRVGAVRWAREHGAAKRVAAIVATLRSLGWRSQQHAPDDSSNAPLLTEDAAMLLVDGYLAAAGAPISCSRDDVRSAFAYLTSPLVAAAVWADDARRAIVLTNAPP